MGAGMFDPLNEGEILPMKRLGPTEFIELNDKMNRYFIFAHHIVIIKVYFSMAVCLSIDNN